MKYSLKCVSCGKEYKPYHRALTCPDCGSFKGTLDVLYPCEELRSLYHDGLSGLKSQSVFEKFLPILPFSDLSSLPPVPVGGTPLFRSPAMTEILGIDDLWFKDDSRNPSASLKDRASAVAIAMAREAGLSTIAAASTGNAASSLATLTASIEMKAHLFVPRTIPRPKLAQLLIHGARVICLDCDYDKAFELCLEACERFGWYNRNTAVNPFTGEGKKTAALEIACDLGRAPDVVVCPVGDGCILAGLHKGFGDLKRLQLIENMPRLYGVEAAGADSLVRAFETGKEIEPLEKVKTIADSISVGYPRDGIKALRAVKNSKGAMISVSDDEILEAQKQLASKAGIFVEPAASAAVAGLFSLKDKQYIDAKELIVVLLTGHGLKDIDTVMENIDMDIKVLSPNIDAIALRFDKE